MPTFMLQFWARDRARGDQMPVEWLVHRQTRQTAEMYGLHDRGLLAPGMRADVNVIDLEGLAVRRVGELKGRGRHERELHVRNVRGPSLAFELRVLLVRALTGGGEQPGRVRPRSGLWQARE